MAQELERTADALPLAKSINLGSNNFIDLSDVPDDQVAELKRQHGEGMIGVRIKAEQLKVDIGGLAMGLGAFNDEAAKATQAKVSITVTHKQKTSFGETEIVIGNTEQAAKGKPPTSDKTLWIIGIVAVFAVVIAALIFHH
jgi:hypothetical protein